MMLRAEDVAVADVSAEHAALDLVGPHAEDVLRAHLDQEEAPVVSVVRRDASCVELLVARAHGPALWNELLAVGDPYGIACVGLEALEHLDVSERLARRRAADAPRRG
jgi:glycine cleavage system aminomethyltransferase T